MRTTIFGVMMAGALGMLAAPAHAQVGITIDRGGVTVGNPAYAYPGYTTPGYAAPGYGYPGYGTTYVAPGTYGYSSGYSGYAAAPYGYSYAPAPTYVAPRYGAYRYGRPRAIIPGLGMLRRFR